MELDELIQRIQNLERVQVLADKPEPEPGFTMQEQKADNEFLRNLLKEKEDKRKCPKPGSQRILSSR